jgi:hypothetical protein
MENDDQGENVRENRRRGSYAGAPLEAIVIDHLKKLPRGTEMKKTDQPFLTDVQHLRAKARASIDRDP